MLNGQTKIELSAEDNARIIRAAEIVKLSNAEMRAATAQLEIAKIQLSLVTEMIAREQKVYGLYEVHQTGEQFVIVIPDEAKI
jgi:hypothetical protein